MNYDYNDPIQTELSHIMTTFDEPNKSEMTVCQSSDSIQTSTQIVSDNRFVTPKLMSIDEVTAAQSEEKMWVRYGKSKIRKDSEKYKTIRERGKLATRRCRCKQKDNEKKLEKLKELDEEKKDTIDQLNPLMNELFAIINDETIPKSQEILKKYADFNSAIEDYKSEYKNN